MPALPELRRHPVVLGFRPGGGRTDKGRRLPLRHRKSQPDVGTSGWLRDPCSGAWFGYCAWQVAATIFTLRTLRAGAELLLAGGLAAGSAAALGALSAFSIEPVTSIV